MAEFTIYTTGTCPYCTSAKGLLLQLNHTYVEKRVDLDDSLMKEIQERAPNVRTVPQIFVKDYRIGGYDDLRRFVDQKELDMIIDMAIDKV